MGFTIGLLSIEQGYTENQKKQWARSFGAAPWEQHQHGFEFSSGAAHHVMGEKNLGQRTGVMGQWLSEN